MQDVSTQYAGTASPEIDLLGNAFYTLQFIRTEADTPEPSEPTVMEAYKKTIEVNPFPVVKVEILRPGMSVIIDK